MANLEVVAVVLGILIVVLRFPAVFWPKEYVSFWRKKVSQEFFTKMMGIVCLLAGIAFIYLIWNEISLLQLLVGGFSILLIVKGLIAMTVPEFPTNILAGLEKKTMIVRMGSLVAVLVGILLVYLGYYGM